jgi:ribosome-associated protein
MGHDVPEDCPLTTTRRKAKAASPKAPASPKTKAAKAPAKKTAPKKAVKDAEAVKAAAPKKRAALRAPKAEKPARSPIVDLIVKSLDDDKAEDVVVIDVAGKSSIADTLVVASGRSARHVAAIAEHVRDRLKSEGLGSRPLEGLNQGDWVLIDAGDVIVHVFRPEVRAFYNLEGMWAPETRARAVG